MQSRQSAQSSYQRLVRQRTSRGLLRELGLGIALLTAIVLGCFLLPALPVERSSKDVGSAPPQNISLAPPPAVF